VLIYDSDRTNDHRWIDMVRDGEVYDVTIPAMFVLGREGYKIVGESEWILGCMRALLGGRAFNLHCQSTNEWFWGFVDTAVVLLTGDLHV
jgi:hypothetical protein